MGYGFPLPARLGTHSAADAATTVGRLYAANTAGSVLGSFAAIFVLASTLGTNTSILWLGALELLVGGTLLGVDHRARGARPALPVGAMAVLGLVAIAAPIGGRPSSPTAPVQRL